MMLFTSFLCTTHRSVRIMGMIIVCRELFGRFVLFGKLCKSLQEAVFIVDD